ncbi:MAG: hypothetical protein ACYDDF_00370 [Thermoplasmatota archaeon]
MASPPSSAPPTSSTRRTATRIVSVAIIIVGLAFVISGIVLARAGTPIGWLLALLAIGVGIAAFVAASMFLLVPFRLDELEEMATEYVREHGPYDPDAAGEEEQEEASDAGGAGSGAEGLTHGSNEPGSSPHSAHSGQTRTNP